MYHLDAVCIIYIIIMRYSIKYQLSVREFNRLISPEQSTASTQTFHQKICLRCLIPHTKLYEHILFICLQREGKSSMSSFQLSDRVLYYRIPITCYTSIIGSFKYNCSPSFHSVMEKIQAKIPCDSYLGLSTGLLSKIHQHRMSVQEFMNYGI